MKKYRLIEYNICHQKGVRLEAKYNSLEQVVDALTILLGDNSECYYRIEEVEESIIDRVKTYEDACRVLGKIPLPFDYNEIEITFECNVKGYHDIVNYPLNAHLAALLKLETITAALNEGWKPDFTGSNEEKYFPIFEHSHGDFRFWSIDERHGTTMIPSRLYFKSSELAEYAAKQFAELYKQLLIEKL